MRVKEEESSPSWLAPTEQEAPFGRDELAPDGMVTVDPSLSSLGEDFSFSGASSSNRILAAPPQDDDASDALITNPLVPVEPWDNYDECFGSNVVEPIPIPLLGDPLASDSATLSVREGASPQSSDLASNKSDETKTAVGEAQIRLKLSKQIDRLPEPYKAKMRSICHKYETNMSELKAKMEALSVSVDGMKQPFLSQDDQKAWVGKSEDLIKSTLEKCLGMLQQLKRNTNRAVPEKDPEVLRRWLFDHFESPYPTPADKEELARQSGYTPKQVSNWFINARVRLWRPMILQAQCEKEQKTKVKEAKKERTKKDPSILEQSKPLPAPSLLVLLTGLQLHDRILANVYL